jgi:hypothetical protein
MNICEKPNASVNIYGAVDSYVRGWLEGKGVGQGQFQVRSVSGQVRSVGQAAELFAAGGESTQRPFQPCSSCARANQCSWVLRQEEIRARGLSIVPTLFMDRP